jgi:LDH2 family malate/lactate/ureidoglycolate dehydrogenase
MNVGHYFQAINVAHFMPVERFEARVDEFIRQLKSSERAPGIDRILLPGEIEFETAARYRDNGVPIAISVIDDLHRIARRVGVSDRLTSNHS